jgi:hypothetical protein
MAPDEAQPREAGLEDVEAQRVEPVTEAKEAADTRQNGDGEGAACSSGESNTRAKRSASATTNFKDGSPPHRPASGDGSGGNGSGHGSRSGSGNEDGPTSAKPRVAAAKGGAAGKGCKRKLARPEGTAQCPRCESSDTKFCYYNNYNIKQPRYFCKACQRYWTAGGILRNVPIGAGRRKSKASAMREQEKAAAAVAAKQARQAAHGGCGPAAASGPALGLPGGEQPQLMSAAGDLLPAGPMAGAGGGFGPEQLRCMMDPAASGMAGGPGANAMMGGPLGSGFSAEDGGRADGRRVRAKLEGGSGDGLHHSAGALHSISGGRGGNDAADDRHPEWAAAAQAAERQQAAALAAHMAAQASMQQAMQAQAQLQGMAAAAQWGQPSTPFGMAGAGMWPAYPAMVAPGYGVGSNWAAAAQLNARFGNNSFGGGGSGEMGGGAVRSPTVGPKDGAAGGELGGGGNMMAGGGWNSMMPTGSAANGFTTGWGMGGDMGGGGGWGGMPHMSMMPAGKHLGSMSSGPAASSLASGQSANTGLQAPAGGM